MQSYKTKTRSVAGALLLGSAIGLLPACGDISFTGPNTGTIANCNIVLDNFPRSGTYTRQQPVQCPFKTNTIGLSVNFAASGSVPSNSTAHHFETTVANWEGFWTNSYIYDTWSQGYDQQGNPRDNFTLSGNYFAATAGWRASDNTGYDVATSRVLLPDGQSWGTATSYMNYKYGEPSIDVSGPTSHYAYGSYTQNGLVHDASFVSPVTWQWFVDGNPTGETGSTLTWQAGPPDTIQEIYVTATDANGVSRSASQFVTACPQEFYC